MKKLLILSLLILPLLYVVKSSTHAAELQWGFTTESGSEVVEQQVYLAKGWNLVAGLANREWIMNGDVKSTDIRAIYAFNPIVDIKKNVRLYPNPNREEVDALPPATLQMSFWVYATKSGNITYKAQMLEPLRMSWAPGWNFVPLTADLIEGGAYPDLKLKDVKGDCIIEKASTFSEGQWTDLLAEDTEMDSTFINKGMVMKVSSECKLGHVQKQSVTPVPPTLPNQ